MVAQQAFTTRTKVAHLLGALLWLLPIQAHAVLLRWFIPTGLNAEVQILNKSESDLSYWVGYPSIVDPDSGQIDYEDFKRIYGQSKQRLDLSTLRSHPWIQIKVHEEDEDSLIIKLRNYDGETQDLHRERANRFIARTPASDFDEYQIANLSETAQTLLITERSKQGDVPKSSYHELPAKGVLQLPKPLLAQSIEVQGTLPLFVSWTKKDSFLVWEPVQDNTPLKDPEHTLFLAVDSSARESFVVPISDPELIAKARQQIQQPNEHLDTIIIGEPTWSAGISNRNLVSPFQASWSWELKTVYGFSSVASDSCNGTPSILEDFLPLWLGSNRLICFRDYRIVYEIPSQK